MTELLDEVARYYSDKIRQHGETPQGVDWNGEESQTIRFAKLCEIVSPETSQLSITDLGCGYGAMFDYLSDNYSLSHYLGVDVSPDMIRAASARYSDASNARFLEAAEPGCVNEFTVASGIFNVRQNRSDEEWYAFIESTLNVMDKASRRGFAFNCLTKYSDEHKKRDYLFYADPCQIFDLCKTKYSRHVALLHDYELYEFTILVRKIE